MERFTKQPSERFTVFTDFKRNFSSGETVGACSVTVTDKDGTDVSATVTDQATLTPARGTRVEVLVRAGSEASSPYKITFECDTSKGHHWEHDIEMLVVEI